MMDLEAEILKEHSKRQTLRIAKWVGSDAVRFEQLMKLFLHGEPLVVQRAAWIVNHCARACPALIDPWLPAMLKKMTEPNVHEAVPRNVLRILEDRDLPRNLLGKVVTICFNYLGSPDAPIAVRAYSMTILEIAAGKEPALRRELEIVIRQIMADGSPGIQASAKRALSNLARQTKQAVTR